MPKWNRFPTAQFPQLTHVFSGKPFTFSRLCRSELSLYLVDLVMGLRRSIFKNCAVSDLAVMTAPEATKNVGYWQS